MEDHKSELSGVLSSVNVSLSILFWNITAVTVTWAPDKAESPGIKYLLFT